MCPRRIGCDGSLLFASAAPVPHLPPTRRLKGKKKSKVKKAQLAPRAHRAELCPTHNARSRLDRPLPATTEGPHCRTQAQAVAPRTLSVKRTHHKRDTRRGRAPIRRHVGPVLGQAPRSQGRRPHEAGPPLGRLWRGPRPPRRPATPAAAPHLGADDKYRGPRRLDPQPLRLAHRLELPRPRPSSTPALVPARRHRLPARHRRQESSPPVPHARRHPGL